MKIKFTKRQLRHKRIRKKIKGRQDKPRLAVFRSNKHIYVQIIDDTKGHTICSFSSLNIDKKNRSTKLQELARIVGENIAKLAKQKGIEKVVFDRGGFSYKGAVKILAESARKAGLKF